MFLLSDALKTLASVQNARLVFMDPPFNIGEPYETCEDNVDPVEYELNLCRWITAALQSISPTGSVWINLPDKWVAVAVLHVRSMFLSLENWCIWHYRFAQCRRGRFLSSKTHALWFSRGDPYVNEDAALVPSDRATLYGDSRIFDTDRGGTRMDFDVWGFDKYWGRVQGNNKERGLTPNQLPEKYLERVIRVCTKPGDLVVDPFCGSGTTATVAHALGRKFITGDISQKYLDAARERVTRGMVR